jgi:hypothetical protein
MSRGRLNVRKAALKHSSATVFGALSRVIG